MSSAIATLGPAVARGPYPERGDPSLSWLDEQGARTAGAVLRRARARRGRGFGVVKRAARLEARFQDLADAEIRTTADELRAALRTKGFTDATVARSFALTREVARRCLGQRHHDVQLLGGRVMLEGMVAEMDTGEGKTLTATLPAVTMALAGIPVHVISVNDYLVGRDAETMTPVFGAMGIRVGTIRQGMSPDDRREAYGCDVTYCNNKEIAFDYLKDRIALGRVRSHARLGLERLARGESRADRLVLRGLWFGIVDEADSVLVDEARTPLIISSGGEIDDLEEEVYETAVGLARELEPQRHFSINARERGILLTPEGERRLRELSERMTGVFAGRHRREDFVSQALSAIHLFERDKQYLVTEGKVQIIDEYTGRVMPDRTWQRGLHQMIEAKESCEISGHTETLARISYQRFFRRYLRLAGMTGTAREVAAEMWSVYRLPVVRIPTNRPPKRKDLGTRVYPTLDAKWRAVIARIEAEHERGGATLVGTRSVEASEYLSGLLDEKGLAHRVLNARQDREEADIVADAGQPGRITVATNMTVSMMGQSQSITISDVTFDPIESSVFDLPPQIATMVKARDAAKKKADAEKPAVPTVTAE